MHRETLERLAHTHDFSVIHEKGEKRTLYVLILTAVTMLVEIAAGTLYGSMALLADGWHMSTHVAAFMITLFAYRYARKHRENPLFSFGTGKVSVLGGFASAVALGIVAFMMLFESLHRMLEPQTILFNEAIAVAFLGLAVNLASAWILKDHHHHQHGTHDHNLRAAYMHVLADAFTSLLAIAALFAGKYLGWNWMDPVMGVVGAVIIIRWAKGLLEETGPILLDASAAESLRSEIRRRIEADADNRISDLHVWKVGPKDYAVILSIVTHRIRSVEHYKALLSPLTQLTHVSVELNLCDAAARTGRECAL
jgi:cation diffusion facilitator family transporter